MKKQNRHPGITRQQPSRRFPKGGWAVRYRNANNATLRRTFKTEREALDFKGAVRTDIIRGVYRDDRKAMTPFATVAEDWFRTTSLLKSWTHKTAAGYRSILDAHLLPEFGQRAVGRINATDIEAMLAELGVSTGTRRNVLRVLKPVMQYAVKSKMIAENPCTEVKLDKADRRKMLFLDAEQVRALADEITPHYRTLVLFAAYSGMRAGEIAALQVKHIDPLRSRVTVERSVSDVGGVLHYGTTKTDRVRTVAVPSFIMKLLEPQMAGKDRDDLVFTGQNGAPLRHGNYYQRHFKPAVKRALPEDLWKLRFHDLRHTAAAILIAQGFHPKIIADRLGHSSIAITMDRYGHLYGDHDEPIKEKLEQLYKDAVPQPRQASVTPIR